MRRRLQIGIRPVRSWTTWPTSGIRTSDRLVPSPKKGQGCVRRGAPQQGVAGLRARHRPTGHAPALRRTQGSGRNHGGTSGGLGAPPQRAAAPELAVAGEAAPFARPVLRSLAAAALKGSDPKGARPTGPLGQKSARQISGGQGRVSPNCLPWLQALGAKVRQALHF